MTQEQLNEQLHEAVYDNDLEAVKKAIKDGADVNSNNVDYAFSTPLHIVSWGWNRCEVAMKIAMILIENGADLYAKDEIGTKPIDTQFIANLLKQHGGV